MLQLYPCVYVYLHIFLHIIFLPITYSYIRSYQILFFSSLGKQCFILFKTICVLLSLFLCWSCLYWANIYIYLFLYVPQYIYTIILFSWFICCKTFSSSCNKSNSISLSCLHFVQPPKVVFKNGALLPSNYKFRHISIISFNIQVLF